jgi:hypothetical protein
MNRVKNGKWSDCELGELPSDIAGADSSLDAVDG